MTAQDVLDDLGDYLADGDHKVVRAERVERKVDDGHGGAAGATAYDCLVRVTRG